MLDLRVLKILKNLRSYLLEHFSKDLEIQQYGLVLVVKPRNLSELREYLSETLKFEIPEFEKELEREIERKELEVERVLELELEG